MKNPFNEPVTTLGKTIGRTKKSFGIYQPDRLFHMFILGQTGTGKTTFMKQMILQDLKRGTGFCMIDPHGDLANELKNQLGEMSIYWDIADPNCPFGYNPLSYVAEKYRPLVASAIIETLKNQWRDAWGVRMEHLLRFSILALLSRKNSSFADIIPMFTNKAFRRKVMQTVKDEEVLKFWRDEFPNMNYKTSFDGVAPIANKLGSILSHPVVRKTLCSPEKPIRFRKIIDEGTPLVINLSKGKLGSGISNLIGGLILSMLSQAALSRENLPPNSRSPYIVYVDEFSNITTYSTASMLSELRKYRVGFVLAAQYTASIKQSVLEAVFGNVGNLVVFRTGALDAPLLANQLGEIDSCDLVNLPNFQNFSKIMVNGVQTRVFSASTRKSNEHSGRQILIRTQ